MPPKSKSPSRRGTSSTKRNKTPTRTNSKSPKAQNKGNGDKIQTVKANSKASSTKSNNIMTVTPSDSDSSSNLSDSRKVLQMFYICGFFAMILLSLFFNYALPGLETVSKGNKNCQILEDEGVAKFFFTKVLNIKIPGFGSQEATFTNTDDSDNSDSDPVDNPYSILISCANSYQQTNGNYLLLGFAAVYFTMQSFVIPGTAVLSILAGALFPFIQAELVVAICSSSGATVSYFFSLILGEAFIDYFGLQEKVKGLKKRVKEETGSDSSNGNTTNSSSSSSSYFKLFSFMTLIRCTPAPNLLINVGAPHAGVPVILFWLSTLIGLIPLNTAQILGGKSVAELGKVDKGPLGVILGVGTTILTLFYLLVVRKGKKEKEKEKISSEPLREPLIGKGSSGSKKKVKGE